MPANCRVSKRLESGVEALVVGHKLAMFKKAAKKPQIHGPAIAGDSPMLVGFGPAGVTKEKPCLLLAVKL